MGALLRRLLKRRMGQGARRGSSFWLLMGGFSLLRRLLGSFRRRDERVVFGHALRPGEEMVLKRGGEAPRSLRKDRTRAAVVTATDSTLSAVRAEAARARDAAATSRDDAKRQAQLAKQLSSRSYRRRAVRLAVRAAKRALR